jgi:cell division protein FtsI/penicillin-binding protein 2
MRMLYDHFQLAPELGSLLDPSTIKADAFTAGFKELQPYLAQALANEVDKDQIERGVMAAGIAKAGEILAQKYTLQITNVPYAKKGKLSVLISKYLETNFPNSKEALETVFLEKMLNSNTIGGITCTVIPQNWLFLTSYKKFREKLLKDESWSIVSRLGA